METYLRLMFLKFRYRLGYESLCREVSDSITWRRFCRIPLDGAVPHPTTLMKAHDPVRQCGGGGGNEALLAKAAEAKVFAHQQDPYRHHGGGGQRGLSHRLGAAGQGDTENRHHQHADPGRRRCRKRHLSALGHLFVQALALCQAAGMVSLGRVEPAPIPLKRISGVPPVVVVTAATYDGKHSSNDVGMTESRTVISVVGSTITLQIFDERNGNPTLDTPKQGIFSGGHMLFTFYNPNAFGTIVSQRKGFFH